MSKPEKAPYSSGPSGSLETKNPLACMARCTLFWKLASWPFAQQLGSVRYDGAQRLAPPPLVLGEVIEHVGLNQLLEAGMPDADAHAPIVVTDMRRDRAQPVVAGDAAAGLEAHLAGRKIDLVVHHHDVGEPELVEMGGFRDRTARL